jgi:hypothetical protein
MASLIRVYEVLYDLPYGVDGPAGDGHAVYRSRSKAAAERFAQGKDCYGRPASVCEDEVPRRLAQRWGLA